MQAAGDSRKAHTLTMTKQTAAALTEGFLLLRSSAFSELAAAAPAPSGPCPLCSISAILWEGQLVHKV